MSKPIEGSVARVEDQYNLIINRGSEHGVEVGMEFAVMSDDGDEIIDPETGDVIGELPSEKLRVRVFEVQPKFSRAETFVHVAQPPVVWPTPPSLGLATTLTSPAMEEMQRRILGNFGDGLSEKLAQSGLYESISQAARRELENPPPVRQRIDNQDPKPRAEKKPTQRSVTVNIGDKVRQIVPKPKNARVS